MQLFTKRGIESKAEILVFNQGWNKRYGPSNGLYTGEYQTDEFHIYIFKKDKIVDGKGDDYLVQKPVSI